MRLSRHALHALKRAAAGLSRRSPAVGSRGQRNVGECMDICGEARSRAAHDTAGQPCSCVFVDAPSVIDLERVIGSGAR